MLICVTADVKVQDLAPGSQGHNLVLKVASIALPVEKKRYDGSTSRIAEAVLGDETGCVTFTARNGTSAFVMMRVCGNYCERW